MVRLVVQDFSTCFVWIPLIVLLCIGIALQFILVPLHGDNLVKELSQEVVLVGQCGAVTFDIVHCSGVYGSLESELLVTGDGDCQLSAVEHADCPSMVKVISALSKDVNNKKKLRKACR